MAHTESDISHFTARIHTYAILSYSPHTISLFYLTLIPFFPLLFHMYVYMYLLYMCAYLGYTRVHIHKYSCCFFFVFTLPIQFTLFLKKLSFNCIIAYVYYYISFTQSFTFESKINRLIFVLSYLDSWI